MWERGGIAALIMYFGLDRGDWSASVFGRLILRKQPPISNAHDAELYYYIMNHRLLVKS